MTTPEIKGPEPHLPEGVKRVEAEMPEPTPEIAEVKTIPTQVSTQVTDGKPPIKTPAMPQVTITLPAALQQLDEWAKGDPQNALTWFAAFWLRIIKKAIHFGWKILGKS